MIILNKKLSLILFVIGLFLSLFLIIDLTIDLLNKTNVESRLTSLSIILVSSIIFFYNWMFQENNREKLKRILLVSFMRLYVKFSG